MIRIIECILDGEKITYLRLPPYSAHSRQKMRYSSINGVVSGERLLSVYNRTFHGTFALAASVLVCLFTSTQSASFVSLRSPPQAIRCARWRHCVNTSSFAAKLRKNFTVVGKVWASLVDDFREMLSENSMVLIVVHRRD